MGKLKIIISGQKFFGEEVLRLCLECGHEVIAVCCPLDDKYIGRYARLMNILIIPAGTLTVNTIPDNIDLGITAHSFDYIGKLTRYRPLYGWIGYHPSLLPRHRGRSSIEWAIRMGDIITGGTIFWLNSGIDRGDIAYQDWCWIAPKLRLMPPKKAAKILWDDKLLPMGISLMRKALNDFDKGNFIRSPQDPALSTFEPSIDHRDIYRPDALMLPEKITNSD